MIYLILMIVLKTKFFDNIYSSVERSVATQSPHILLPINKNYPSNSPAIKFSDDITMIASLNMLPFTISS